jgi:hypothetical protein
MAKAALFSMGGCGTSFYKSLLEDYVELSEKYTNPHLIEPPDLTGIKAVFFYDDVLKMLLSYFKRHATTQGWAQKHCQYMGGDWEKIEDDWTIHEYLRKNEDLFRLKEHYKNWYYSNQEIMFVRYGDYAQFVLMLDFMEIPQVQHGEICDKYKEGFNLRDSAMYDDLQELINVT